MYLSYRMLWNKLSRHKRHLLLTLVGVNDWIEVEIIAKQIFSDCWSSKSSDVSLIAQSAPDVVRLYTFSPYDEKNCGIVKSIAMNEFSKNGSTSELNMNVNKFKNMHKCNLTVAIYINTTLLSIRTNENGEQYLEGIEGKIINLLAHAMNFTVGIIELPPRNIRPVIIEMVNVSYSDIPIL